MMIAFLWVFIGQRSHRMQPIKALRDPRLFRTVGGAAQGSAVHVRGITLRLRFVCV